jgi:hypothetical protein
VEAANDASSKKGKRSEVAKAPSRQGGFQVEFLNMGKEGAG